MGRDDVDRNVDKSRVRLNFTRDFAPPDARKRIGAGISISGAHEKLGMDGWTFRLAVEGDDDEPAV